MTVAPGLHMQRGSFKSRILSGIKSLAEQFVYLLRRLAAWIKGLDPNQVTVAGIVTTFAGAIVTVAGIVIGLISMYRSLWPREAVSLSTNRTEQAIQAPSPGYSPLPFKQVNDPFALIQPVSGEGVGATVRVECTSLWPGWNYYPVVTPVTKQPNPPKWIQKALAISPRGTRVGEAIIGRGPLDRHKQFLVSCLATRTPLSEGQGDLSPGDTQTSTAVKVELTHE